MTKILHRAKLSKKTVLKMKPFRNKQKKALQIKTLKTLPKTQTCHKKNIQMTQFNDSSNLVIVSICSFCSLSL